MSAEGDFNVVTYCKAVNIANRSAYLLVYVKDSSNNIEKVEQLQFTKEATQTRLQTRLAASP